MTTLQVLGILALLVFGFLFDVVVSNAKSFFAPYVVVGCAVTVLTVILDSPGVCLNAAHWGFLTLAHFAASGTGMTLGSWERRKRS